MIRIENISKQNSHRILFIEASAALNRGESVGLVGPMARERPRCSG
jgi:ATPase subunit of ABC transporter with duplicated ATPase domains